MGAPGYTVFCENGHVVDIVGHHEISQHDASEMYCPVHGFGGSSEGECSCVKRQCCICGSNNFRQITEWGDPDYLDNDGAGPVPFKSIGQDGFASDKEAVVITKDGERVTGKLVVTVNKYDVSRLFEEEDE